MGTVRNLHPAQEQDLEEFCNFLYGMEVGFIHVPIKDPSTGRYEYNHFFEWPRQKVEVINHVIHYSKHYEVFIAPSMFKTHSSSTAEAHGSYVAWADFDGDVPTLQELQEAGVPEPTLRVQSSIPGREHWYWRYDQFNTDIASIQGINKAIAYALGGDVGGWYCGHSLRPVGSINHKRGGLPVHVKGVNNTSFRIEDFAQVPIPKEVYTLEQYKKEQIPGSIRVMMKYGPWSKEAQDLFSKAHIRVGSRSSALTRLAYICCEQGLDNSEVYSILQWKDKHWRKFFGRPDKERYYVSLINYCRQKIPYEGIKDVPVVAEGLEWHGFKDVLEYKDTTEWVLQGLLPEKSNGYIVGRPGTGKTTLALGLCTHLALGKKYLDWGNEGKSFKVGFVSLDMPSLEEVNSFYRALAKNFTEEELDLLQERFKTYASPTKIKFYNRSDPTLGKFLRDLENMQYDILLVDSAVYSLASNLNNQEEVGKSLEVLDEIRNNYNCTFLFIHHSRKDPPGHGHREADLDDMFGSVFIAASASWVMALKKSKNYSDENKIIDVRNLKARYTGDSAAFSVVMDGETRMFRRPSMGELMVASPTPKSKPRKNKDDSLFSI